MLEEIYACFLTTFETVSSIKLRLVGSDWIIQTENTEFTWLNKEVLKKKKKMYAMIYTCQILNSTITLFCLNKLSL